ncbi:MAG: homoserine dehydrogenase [Lachnospiraceae bacterium]|nr:homoserine dehydrogenase [Lachnospiraceae bacterium]
MINIAVLGYGTIGSGVVEVIDTNGESIAERAGDEINVKYVLDLRDFPGSPVENKIVHDYDVILNDPDIKVVVEVMGGVEPAHTFVKNALLKGKSVATSNKALVAKHGAELLQVAKDNGANFLFEASVGGGIPIIRPLYSSFTADKILEITGILNGTTNYMLTKMANQGLEFDDVLKQAQDLGYAEKDPTADVGGFDACRKIAILTSLMCGKQVDFEDIYTEGITDISAVDFKYAKVINKSIKLFATTRQLETGSPQGSGIVSMVSPVLIGPEHPLFAVNDVFNAVFVKGNVLGDTMLYGSGAGKLPTASAVVSDVIDLIKHFKSNIKMGWSPDKLTLLDRKMIEHGYFVRVKGTIGERIEAVEKAFGKVIFIEAPGVEGEFAFITSNMPETDYDKRIADIPDVIKMIRIEEHGR